MIFVVPGYYFAFLFEEHKTLERDLAALLNASTGAYNAPVLAFFLLLACIALAFAMHGAVCVHKQDCSVALSRYSVHTGRMLCALCVLE